MQKSVIIVAGGIGSRMKSDIPKQFLFINGKPILMHTIEKFYQYDNSINIILILPANQLLYWQSLVEKQNFIIPLTIDKGGETRFQSVKNGLEHIKEGIVGIHDAVRPLVSLSTIKSAFDMAEKKGNAVPVISVNESIRIINDTTNQHIDRNTIKIVQTPQCFEVLLIKQAYNQDYKTIFTDDASVVENTGKSIYLSEGNLENIKITTAYDLKLAEVLIKSN
jgi:2-C-methyl-D-erythritol 4-phosphate cytidylyltransferase